MQRLCINWNKNVYYLLSISGCLGIIFIVAIAVVPEKSQLKKKKTTNIYIADVGKALFATHRSNQPYS